MTDDLKNKPSFECDSYLKQQVELTIVRALSAGTLYLREKGQAYLPMEMAEDSTDYSIRRSRAIFFNAFERALHSLVGRVFREEPKLSETVPEILRGREAKEDSAKVEGYLENIDLAGSHWTVWAKELFTETMRDGHAFIYVDMPPPLPEGSTLADERSSGRRPYWVSYSKDQAINWRIDERGKLQQITFKETILAPDGDFGEKEIARYRVLRPGEWILYEEQNDGNKTNIIETDRGITSLSEIPVAVVYARKCGSLKSKPPLIDLALINIAHYQKYSDYSIYIHICSRPLLCFKGRDQNKKIEAIGPFSFADVAEGGDVWFAETSGAALSTARQDLLDLQEQMAILGTAMLAKKVPNRTATEEYQDNVKEESDLSTAARSLKDGIELALMYTAQYLNHSSGGKISLGVTMDELVLNPDELRAYTDLVSAGILSKPTVRARLKEANKLPEDYDEQEERRRLKSEATEQQRVAVNAVQPALSIINKEESKK